MKFNTPAPAGVACVMGVDEVEEKIVKEEPTL